MEQTKTSENIKIWAGILTSLIFGIGVLVLLLLKPWEIILPEIYSVSVGAKGNLITVEETIPLELMFTVLDEKKANRAEDELQETVFSWRSSDESIATVDGEGNVTGVGPGTATIYVEGGGLSSQYLITVYRELKGVTLSEKELTANVGDSVTLTYELDPKDAGQIGKIKWNSADTSVAEVSEDGKVTMKQPGTAEICLTVGEFAAKCVVTVKSPLEKIELNKNTLGLYDGQSASLQVFVFPENTTDDTTVTWTSSDEAVAVVDENGTVTAVDPGVAVICATVGSFEVTCEVKVTAPMTAFSIQVTELTLINGDSSILPVKFEPENTTDDQNIAWSSRNEAVAKVDSKGKVTAVGAGSAVITATCGEFISQCSVKVVIPVNSVVINQTKATLNKGETITLTAAVGPTNTTEDRSIEWSSDNAAVATVKNGVVTAINPGIARIIARHGDYVATCVVTVYSPMSGIEFEQNTLSVVEGYSGNLSVLFVPADTTDKKDVKWSSSDEEIATVDQDGKVNGVAVGTCEITATCGAFSVTCEVTVQPYIEVEEITIDVMEHDFGEIGETLQLSAVVLPDNASFGLVSFVSSNPNVATVNANGVVRAVGEGTAVITATAGEKSAQCTVTVPKPDIVVVLDPGHGGKYSGASYYGYREQDLTLKVAWYCRRYLEENYIGVKVYMTRETDKELVSWDAKADLEARAQFAKNVDADALVSMHFNAHPGHAQRGCEVWSSHQPHVSTQCASLGHCILNQLSALGIANRGVKVDYSIEHFDQYGRPLDGYAINRHCASRNIPGIIVEHCFMDSQIDLVFYNSEEALERLGIADAIGIANYFGLEKR